jgi:uncharacterized protein (UPF0335 family)
MQGDNTSVIVVTAEIEAIIGKVRKLEWKNFDIFSHLKDFMEENRVGTNNTRTGQCIKDQPLILLPDFQII